MKFIPNHLLLSAFGLLIIILLSGCGDIISDLKLNSNGSGTLSTTFELGDLMSMAKGFKGMGADSTGFTDDTVPEPVVTKADTSKDPMQKLMAKITDPNYDRNFDTLMAITSIMPDSVKSKITQPALANKIKVRFASPAKSANLTIGIVADFDNSQQLKEMMQLMQTLDENPDMLSGGGPLGFQPKSFMVFDADMKAGTLKVAPIDYGDMASQFGAKGDSTSSSENLGMLQMMFGNSKIKSVIHVPGEVLSCTNKDAILTKDNRVLLEYNFMDVIQKGSIDGFTIHFQPGK
ncbi:MAG: hypothetical protein ABJC12_05800 [Saprospiraceae bacterium]